MRLRHSADYTIETLTRVAGELRNCRTGNGPAERRDCWLRWWSTADAQLRNLFAGSDMAASLYVSQEKVRDVNLGALPLGLLNREIDVWVDRFEDLITELKTLKPFIERPGHIVVPDTSAFIEGTYFTDLAWHAIAGVTDAEPVRLVVPILVVEELDDHKQGRGDRVPRRARSVLRRLWELHASGTAQAAVIPGRPVTVEVFGDGQWHVRRPVNDDEIIERAAAIGEITGQEVVLAAADYAMLYRAAAAGLKAALVPGRTTPLTPGHSTCAGVSGWNGGCKHRLTPGKVQAARDVRAAGHSVREIGQLLGNGKPVSRQTVYRALGML